MNLWAVIPSRDRPGLLADLVSTLVSDNVNVVVIDTGYEPPWGTYHGKVTTLRDTTQPPNISRWWNLGLDYAQRIEGGNEHVVAVLNDDVIVPKGFVQRLAVFITTQDAVAAYPDQHDYFIGKGGCLKHTVAEPVSLYTRMCGYAFALRGSARLRADEKLEWWYGDDDLDWRARQAGGSVLVGGLKVQHVSPNSTTIGELAAQTGRDRQTFINKWGRAPW